MRLTLRLMTASVLFASLSPASAAEPFEPEAICRAAIASIAGRDPKAMQVTRVAGNVLFLSYVRPRRLRVKGIGQRILVECSQTAAWAVSAAFSSDKMLWTP